MGNSASHHHQGSNSSGPRSRGDSSPGQQVPTSTSSSSNFLSSPLSGSSDRRNRTTSVSLSSTFAPSSIFAASSSSTSPSSKAIPLGPSTPPGLVDGGHLNPQGQYATRPIESQDYNHIIVKHLIIEKKLAPFYRGLEDYEEEWGEEEVVGALRELRGGGKTDGAGATMSERERREAIAYKGATECPICFLVSRNENSSLY